MRFPHGTPSRALLTLTATAAVAIAAAAPAAAHIHVDADDATPGTTSVLTFKVPGESETGALTTEFTVDLPNVASARTEAAQGWVAKLDRDIAAGTVRSVTWAATPGVGISPDQFGLFRISVTLPKGDSVTFPATQRYSDGTAVRWDQAPLPGGGEPEHPAPELSLSGSADPAPSHDAPAPVPAAVPPTQPAGDTTARWLAGGALVLAALGLAAALAGRRRA